MGDERKRSRDGERLFVSLDPTETVRRAVAYWGREASAGIEGSRPVSPGSVHLTLAFLGNRSRADREAVLAALRETEAHGADLATSGPVLLPRSRPRALAIGVSDTRAELDALRTEVLDLLETAIGWRPERPGFLPHLTAVRIGRGWRGPGSAGFPPTPSLEFRASDLVLYRSRLSPTGATYEALGRLDLDSP